MGRCRVKVAPGRALFAVSHHQGPPAVPMALYDPGAFGIYADGHWVSHALAARGIPTVSYSRAGLYKSDPVPDGAAPTPRWHAEDMARLLDACGVTAPILLVGHSMAGLRLHAFCHLFPERVAGVLLIDAVTPAQLGWTARRRVVRGASQTISLYDWVVGYGWGRKVVRLYPNNFKLVGRERADKQASWGDQAHVKATRAEIWASTAAQIQADCPPITHCPVGSVYVTPVARGDEAVLAHAAKAGQYTERGVVQGAGHANILCPDYADQIAQMGERLLTKAAGRAI